MNRKVITLKNKHKIIERYLRGESKSHIARELSLSRDTVRKYITEYTKHQKALNEAKSEADAQAIVLRAHQAPTYNSTNRKRYVVTPEIQQRLEAMIEANQEKIRKGQRKLIQKKIDMYQTLIEEGYELSYRTVCYVVSNLEAKPKEAFIKQHTTPGEMAEFDWGDVTLTIASISRKPKRYKLGIFALNHSNYLYARLYPNENTESFNDIHVRYFEHLAGSPHEIVYDNAKVAVKRFTKQGKEPTDALKTLARYYGFTPRFTNTYRGNEKGVVERSVEWLRRSAFSGKQHFETVDEVERHLEATLLKLNAMRKQRTGKNANAALAEERAYLHPQRIPLDVSVQSFHQVNRYGFIYVNQNFYSVPDYAIGERVMVRKYPFKLDVLYQNVRLASHNRLFEQNDYQVDITHFVETLKKKPGALKRSLILRQSTTWLQNIYANYYSTNPRDFVKLLELIKHHGIDKVRQAVDTCLNHHTTCRTEQIRYALIGEHPVTHPSASTTIEHHAQAQLQAISQLYGDVS